MANAIWIVSMDVDDDQHVMGVFSSRRKMFTALDEQYGDTLKLHFDHGWGQGIRDGYTDFFELRRYKINELSRLNFSD